MGAVIRENKNFIATQIRIPEDLHKQIKDVSESVGDSQNGTMLHLIALGLRLYKYGVTIPSER